jgi:hypothetical protein
MLILKLPFHTLFRYSLLLFAIMKTSDQNHLATLTLTPALEEKSITGSNTTHVLGQSSPPTALEPSLTSKENIEAIQLPSAQDLQVEEPVRNMTGIKWIVCVLSIYSSVFLYALDNTIVATIQPAIIKDLGHIEKLPWVSVGYQATSVALDLTWYVHSSHAMRCEVRDH